MDVTGIKLTVFFEDPFWVGVFERTCGDKLSACKVIFGAEPKDYEVYAYILAHFPEQRFSPSVAAENRCAADNPKRRQRAARRQTDGSGVGTRSQQALQLQREALKVERRAVSREQRDAEKQRQYEIKRQKRKDRHKGR